MPWHRNRRSQPRPDPPGTWLGLELVACEIGAHLITLDCVALDGEARGWPFMLPLLRPRDRSVLDGAETLLRWVSRSNRIEMTARPGPPGEPARVILSSDHERVELISACDGPDIER